MPSSHIIATEQTIRREVRGARSEMVDRYGLGQSRRYAAASAQRKT